MAPGGMLPQYWGSEVSSNITNQIKFYKPSGCATDPINIQTVDRI